MVEQEAEAFLLGLKLGGLHRSRLEFRGYDVERMELLAQVQIERGNGVEYWIDWANCSRMVGHPIGSSVEPMGVFPLFSKFEDEVWSKLDPGGVPSLDAVWQARIRVERDKEGKLSRDTFLVSAPAPPLCCLATAGNHNAIQHTHPNLVVTTLANNSLKYRNPPPVHWIDVALFTRRYHNSRLWRSERFGADGNKHANLIIIARLLQLQILVYRA